VTTCSIVGVFQSRRRRPVHRAKKIGLLVAAHADQIELQFLPGYSPERSFRM
jgi:hypothetical protein